MLRTHLNGVLIWTSIRITNGDVGGMNNKIKAISHRAFGYRTSWAYIANIYHCYAGLPLPCHLWARSQIMQLKLLPPADARSDGVAVLCSFASQKADLCALVVVRYHIIPLKG